jgi:hypothetical protein
MKSVLIALFASLLPLYGQEKNTSGSTGNLSSMETEPTSTRRVQISRLSTNDVISIRNGRFFLDGKPFAEISFNKFDLLWQLHDQAAAGKPLDAANPIVRTQDKALRNLHKLGFRSIRVFALPWGSAGPASYADPEKRKTLYAALDKMVELCDAHDIRVVWSLGAGSFTDTKLEPGKGWVYGEEQERELMSNPDSRDRKLLYRYIDETIARYKNCKTVLMWEISNELTLLADIGMATGSTKNSACQRSSRLPGSSMTSPSESSPWILSTSSTVAVQTCANPSGTFTWGKAGERTLSKSSLNASSFFMQTPLST